MDVFRSVKFSISLDSVAILGYVGFSIPLDAMVVFKFELKFKEFRLFLDESCLRAIFVAAVLLGEAISLEVGVSSKAGV